MAMAITQSDLQYIGWGISGEPADGVIVQGPEGPSVDVTGYNESDYWERGEFLGPDPHGIVPIYLTKSGEQFPADAEQYPHLA